MLILGYFVCGLVWLVILGVVVQEIFDSAVRKANNHARELVGHVQAEVNRVLRDIGADVKSINGKATGAQSKIDKFVAEIGNNGVATSVLELKSAVGQSSKNSEIFFEKMLVNNFGSDEREDEASATLFERIEALEDFLNVEYKVDKEVTKGYVKAKK